MNAVRTVTLLELRQRIRSTRWKWTALALFALISAVVFGSLYIFTIGDGDAYDDWAPQLLTIVLLTVLFVGLIGAPAISAATINGDRRDATLAVVQATPINGWQLALGKFLGSWLASLTFIALALPYLIWGVVEAHNSVWSSLLAIMVTALLLGAYCAIGLGFSSLSTRPTASTMLTLATVLFLSLGLPAIFGLSLHSTSEDHRVLMGVENWDQAAYEADPEDYRAPCTDEWQDRTYEHSEKTWWLLSPNPLFIVADAQAAGMPSTDRSGDFATEIAGVLSDLRQPPEITSYTCAQRYVPSPPGDSYKERERRYIGHEWWIGLAVTIALGVIGFLIAARRLRVPAGELPKGVRVA